MVIWSDWPAEDDAPFDVLAKLFRPRHPPGTEPLTLTVSLRSRLRDEAARQGRTETWLLERAVELLLWDPALTPGAVEQLRIELAAAHQEIERLAAEADAANTRYARLQMERRSGKTRSPKKGVE